MGLRSTEDDSSSGVDSFYPSRFYINDANTKMKQTNNEQASIGFFQSKFVSPIEDIGHPGD